MIAIVLQAFFKVAIFISLSKAESNSCRCVPTSPCWPSHDVWQELNSSVSGELIRNNPPAASCYPGPLHNIATCAYVDEQWTNATFQARTPLGLSYPINQTCYPVNVTAGEVPGSCILGDAPIYTINATTPQNIATGIRFARDWNIRLVVRNTGHDLLGRSTGYGSLEVWIRYVRQGLTFQETYPSQCSRSNWTGSAFFVGGGYVWADIYPEAARRNVVVVGGGDPDIGCIGGWMQGGGHSPATHDHGLGADQLLEATVALANGQIVTADACQNSDLYFAIRGGGGGSYGVVVSAMIKAYPTTIVSAQLLAMAPLTGGDTLAFMEALAVIYAAYPDLSDGGFSGYGSWSIASPTPIFASYTIGMVHAIAIFNKSIGYAENLFAPIAEKLQPYRNTSLYISTTYSSFPTYDAYYNALSGANVPVSASFAGGSRLLDRPSLTANATALKQMLNVTAGTPDQYTSNNICLVGGGQVFADAKDPYSGVNPAWRTAYVHNIVARGWESPGTDAATITAIRDDITSVKVQAMKDLAPNTGCYMNEADRLDPEYEADFYGGHLARLEAIKEEYDSEGVFYCPTCIGSKNWIVEETGRLCPA